MTHMLNLEEQMTGLKRKSSDLPGDQPPPKLLKQTTSTTLDTAVEKESDIDSLPPPVLEKADTYEEDRPKAVPYGIKANDNGSDSSTPPPVLPRFPTLQPTKLMSADKYFGFDIPSDSDDEDDTIRKIAESISVGEDSVDSISSVKPKMSSMGTNTPYDNERSTSKKYVNLKRADTLTISDSNGSNGEEKKAKLIKKGIIKKVMSPKKSLQSKKSVTIKKEKSVILNLLESLRTVQKMPSGATIEKIMKFGNEEVINLPSDRSLTVYEFDDEKFTSITSSNLLQRPSLQVVSDTLKSVEDEAPADSSALPKLECVSSEELSADELSDSETNNSAPVLQKMCITSPTKSPKKFIHGGIREIVFSFDTTGSMYSYMEETKEKLREIVERLKIDIPGVRLAFVAHGDYYDLKNDRYLIKWLDFGATIDEICNFFEYLPITHGGDADECYELVLRKVRESLSWTTGSQRCLVMIGDSDPHEPGYQFEDFKNDIDWKEETKKLNEMGVRIYGMQVGYRSDFYRQISQTTGGAHLRLESANLTPDMVMSVCLREGNLKLLKTYEAEVMKRPEYKTGLDLELARLFSSLKNVADNIAMKFKKNIIEGSTENGKKAIKRENTSTTESPGTKIAKMAKKALAEDGKVTKKVKTLSPERKQSTSDKIAKNLIKKAIKGTKEKKKTALTKEKKKISLKSTKKSGVKNIKEKKKTAAKLTKKPVVKKDMKKKPTKPGVAGKKAKIVLGSKVQKTISKGKQTATKVKAKSVMKAILKSKTVKPSKKTLSIRPNTKLKAKNTAAKKVIKNKTITKGTLKKDPKNKTLGKVKSKETPAKKTVKMKVKTLEIKKKEQKKLVEKKKDASKQKTEKKAKKSSPEKKKTKPQEKKATKKKNDEKEKKSVAKTSKKTETKKSTEQPIKVKKPKNLQPREIASIAKFVTGPLSCLSWEQWTPLIAHEKPRSGNWSKGKGGCPGYCNSDIDKDKDSVLVMYEFAVSPPDSSKKYPVYFYAQNENVWEFCKDKYIQRELERVIKSKGSVSVRKGTVNKNDETLFLKTVEHVRNMFDYAWNSNASKDTARKDDLVKEGFIIAKV
ncbi:uncharacterized protein LOC127724271 [Mytilus californianus]|uniref:uncharacterized protein LOC127724271 n=1 Tax=Mytilus californianus TaxID=6549 RepID=UPI002246358A|nr:uncharacterized protein LOC127724271 [Mytilus californianus]